VNEVECDRIQLMFGKVDDGKDTKEAKRRRRWCWNSSSCYMVISTN